LPKVDGTAWPPCHLTGADYSADGVHFEHGGNESTIPADQFYDIIGQNDGTLDVAVYDEHLGYFWGLVRVDAGFVGRPVLTRAFCHYAARIFVYMENRYGCNAFQ
jgi:hypothetical protein